MVTITTMKKGRPPAIPDTTIPVHYTRDFYCEKCSMPFNTKKDKKRHMSKVHRI